MRLEGQAKAGFYPTPLEVARLIGSCLVAAGAAHLLDPCCATGAAIETVRRNMQGYTRSTTHGVELEQERAQEAVVALDKVLVGDSLKARVKGGVSLLYLNPPYDQADGKRQRRYPHRLSDQSKRRTDANQRPRNLSCQDALDHSLHQRGLRRRQIGRSKSIRVMQYSNRVRHCPGRGHRANELADLLLVRCRADQKTGLQIL